MAEEAVNPEFRYVAHIRAFEAFRNVLRHEDILIAEGSDFVGFSSSKLLDMKSYKQRGLIWSYTIIRIQRKEDVIEEG